MTSTGSPQIWFVAFVAAALAATASPARADDKNEVRAVTFDEDGGATRVHVRGAQTPTFTVYKLEKPTRVVIDVPQARLAEAVRGHDSSMVLSPNTWAVSTIAAQQLEDGGTVVRVIVTLARPGRYDVKTDGNEVIVTVMARDVAPKTANPAELEAARKQAASAEQAKTQAEQAKTQAEQAKSQAEQARAQAEQVSAAAQDQAAKATARAEAAQRALEDAKQLQKKNAATSADLERAKVAALAAQNAATTAQNDATRAKAEAAKASSDMAKAKADVAKANDAAMTAQADAERTRAAAEQAKRDADAQLQQAKSETANARREAQDLKTAMSSEIAKAREDVARARDEAQKAHADADAAKADAAREKSNADAIRVQADAARAAAAADKRQAEAEKREAIATRADAEKMVASAKDQVAALAKKTAAAQALEDQARTANAAAQAREENARNEANRAAQERLAAETAAQKAQEARDKSTTQAASERARLVAEAKAAEERLAQAKRSTQEAEARRVAAETAADNAKDQLDRSKVSLSSIDHDRQTAEAAATDAVRKRSEAEAAANDAARKRSEAEAAASEAAKRQHLAEVAAGEAAQRRGQAEEQRAAAEAQRLAAEQAAHAAQVAKDAAEHQRAIAEKSAKDALGAQHNAEASLAELMDRRATAEKAAAAVEERAKAEAKAQEQVAAAKARKAGEDELAKANAAAAKIETERKHAETELAERRKAVTSQQAEVARLETAAMQAKDAADREESRRAQLAQKRADEEQQLALLQAKKATVQQQIAATPVSAPAPVAPAPIAKIAPAPIAPAPIAPAPIAKITPAPTAPAPTAKPVAIAKAPPAPVAKNAQINDVRFTGDADGGEVQLAIAGDADVKLGEVTPKFVELVIDRADLAAKLERKLDVSALGGPVRSVSSFHDRQQPGRVHIIAELGAPVTPTLERDGTGAQVKFAGIGQIAKKSPGPRTQEVPPPIVSGFGAASTPIAQQSVSQVPPPNAPNSRRRIYHGATVDLDFKDAPIHDLLRTIASVGHISLVVPETVDAKVTVSLKHVPWDQALDVILSSHGLWYRREGNIFRVAPRKELDAEDEAEAARREAAIKAEAPRPEIVTLNYATASEVKPKLDGMLSPKGKLEVDDRTNALIINDVTGNRQQIAQLAYQLDTQTPQITVEARIVEADSNFTRDIGIQWGGNALAGATGGNATGLTFPSSIGITGANVDQNTISTGVASPSDFAVNLPAATGSGAGGAIGFSLGSLAGNFNINLRLSALEDNGTVRIISAPKVTVLNGREAKIAQGTSVPISVVSAAGTNTQFIQADLSLTVKPYVSQRDCTIAMDLNVTNNQPDFTHTSANGIPTIQRKEAHTRMLVRDGETSVLGGIYTRSTGVQYSKVPFLGDLPVFGWLFKRRTETDNRGELLVFMTPKITNRAALRCTE